MDATDRANLIRTAAQSLIEHDAAGRVCDPLSLEWARTMLEQNPTPKTPAPDIRQIIYALERAEKRLQSEAAALMDARDYSAEFPAEDALRMREAIALLGGMP